MSAPINAASASEIVERIGSYAGYASIIGLGVLALLYFTQAREVKRLREWAGRAPERDAELAERVQADAQRRVVAQPLAPSSAAGQQADAARAAAAAAAVYASIGAQPPGAPSPPGQLARPATAPGAPATGAPAPGAVAAPGAAAPVPSSAAAGAPAPGTLPAAPAPAATAGTQTPTPTPTPGTRPVVTATPTPTPAPSPAAATAAARIAATSRAVVLPNGATSQDTTESAAARPASIPYKPAVGAVAADDDGDGSFGMSTGRVAMIVGGATAAVVVAIVLMVVLTGGSEDPAPPNDFGNTPSAQEPADTPGTSGDEEADPGAGSSASQGLTSAERRATNVAVLNGTTQTGLARSVGDKIQEEGYTISGVATNADQSVPTTIVAYTAGHEEAALAVAKVIGVDRGSVQAADVNTTVAADADVVVTVGSDKLG